MHPLPPRNRISSQQAWSDFTQTHQFTAADIQTLRFSCYRDIEALRGRPLIVYATRLDAPAGAPISIDLNDVDGFTDLVNSLKWSKSVDVLLHSPGGSPDATERIVNILRNAFDEVHFLIPHSAYSAATMLALSGNSITMHSSATLGPIDPQLNGVPARTIKKGFERVKETLKDEGAAALPAYIPLLEKYSLHLLELCEDSEELSRRLVKEWIRLYMLPGQENVDEKIEEAVTFFADYDNHLTHSRPLVYSKLTKFDLPIYLANDDLCELLWEAYTLIGAFFSVTPFVKLFENTYGTSWGRQFQQIQMQMPIRSELIQGFNL